MDFVCFTCMWLRKFRIYAICLPSEFLKKVKYTCGVRLLTKYSKTKLWDYIFIYIFVGFDFCFMKIITQEKGDAFILHHVLSCNPCINCEGKISCIIYWFILLFFLPAVFNIFLRFMLWLFSFFSFYNIFLLVTSLHSHTLILLQDWIKLCFNFLKPFYNLLINCKY